MMETGLFIRDVSKAFAGLRAVDKVSLTATCGKITAVIGPNGAGKTTLFNCVTGLLEADQSDSILVRENGREEPLRGRSQEEICTLGIARTFQQVRLFDSLSVIDNVALGRLVQRSMSFPAILLDRVLGRHAHRTLHEEARTFLNQVGLGHLEHVLAGALDHGNRRRLEIARALATGPSVLLLDEPAAGMNRVETAKLMDLLKSLRAQNLAVLLIEHDMHLVTGVSDWIYVLNYGRLLAQGTPSDVVHHPEVIEAYLGTSVPTAC
jgi:branched-chain amino acid transport system ATP-binding protein